RVNQRVNLSQTLLNATQWQTYQRSIALVERARIDLAISQEDLALRLIKAWLDALSARDQHTLILTEQAAILEQYEVVQARFNLGQVAVTELEETKSRLQSLQARMAQANTQVTLAQLRIAAIVGDAPVRIPPASFVQPFLPGLEQADSIEQQVHANWALQRALKLAQISQIELRAAGAGHLPSLSIQMSVNRRLDQPVDGSNGLNNSGNSDQKTLAAVLSVPVFQGGRVVAQTEQSRQRLNASQAQYELVVSDAKMQAHSAKAKISGAFARLVALGQAITASESVLNAYTASYQVGLRTNADVLEAQFHLGKAKSDWLLAKYDLLLGFAEYHAALGKLNDSTLATIDLALLSLP
ncbi:MAG: TolC family protein, partial [Limnobacter sp.]|nr:TolC family protein [Limnobacter sp.]